MIALAVCLSISGLAVAVELDYNNVDWHQLKVVWNTLTQSEQDAYMGLYEQYMAANKVAETQVTVLGVPLVGKTRTPGDDCGSASADVSAIPYTDLGDTTGTVDDYDISTSATCATGFTSTAGDMVYQFRVDQDCELLFTESAAAHDVVLWAVTDCADVDNTCVGASDGGNPENFFFVATAGTDYWVIVDGWQAGQEGGYTLDVTDQLGTGCSLVPVELQTFSAE